MTATDYVTAIPQRTKVVKPYTVYKGPFGCNGYVTAVAVGQRQRLYSGVRIAFTWFYLSSINVSGWGKKRGLIFDLAHWYHIIVRYRNRLRLSELRYVLVSVT